MPNIFGKSNLFATHESIESLQEYVEGFSNAGEKALAYAIMGMTWNLAAKLYEEEHPEALEDVEPDEEWTEEEIALGQPEEFSEEKHDDNEI